jgi:hypothetical protein
VNRQKGTATRSPRRKYQVTQVGKTAQSVHDRSLWHSADHITLSSSFPYAFFNIRSKSTPPKFASVIISTNISRQAEAFDRKRLARVDRDLLFGLLKHRKFQDYWGFGTFNVCFGFLLRSLPFLNSTSEPAKAGGLPQRWPAKLPCSGILAQFWLELRRQSDVAPSRKPWAHNRPEPWHSTPLASPMIRTCKSRC